MKRIFTVYLLDNITICINTSCRFPLLYIIKQNFIKIQHIPKLHIILRPNPNMYLLKISLSSWFHVHVFGKSYLWEYTVP